MAHKGTFEWIMAHPTSTVNRQAGCIFKEWLQDDYGGNRMFWLSGKPASGKSTLMKYIHNEEKERLKGLLSQWTQSNPPVIAGFYFSEEAESVLGKTQEGLLRALLHQILAQSPELWATVLSKKLQEHDWSLATSFRPTSVSWTWNELRKMFELALTPARNGRHFYIFADGLDEYHATNSMGRVMQADDDDDEADIRIEGHTEIADLFLQISKNINVKICVSSRSQSPFEDLFKEITLRNLRFKMENLTRADIEALVNDRIGGLEQLKILDECEPDFSTEVVSSIVQKAAGVFTWVDLVTKGIKICLCNGDNHAEIREYLRHVPLKLGGPNGLYMSLLRGVKKRYRQDSARLLKVMMKARHPLTAVALSFCEQKPDQAIRSPIEKRTEAQLRNDAHQMELRIRSRCAGLLEMSPNKSKRHRAFEGGHINAEPVVRFIHLTAREFLGKQVAWDFLLNEGTIDFDPNVCLLGSCLLRLKRIGVTGDHEDVWGAVHDAIYYAREAEISTGTHQAPLLDDLDFTMTRLVETQWPDELSAKIYGNYTFRYPPKVQGGFHWVLLEPQEQGGKKYSHEDNFLSYAVWGNLNLFLKTKSSDIKKRAVASASAVEEDYSIGPRPLLWLAIAPDDPPSLLNYSSDNGDRLGLDQCNSSTVRLLLENGCDPWEDVRGQTIWEHMMRWTSRLKHRKSSDDPHECVHDSNYMDIMKVMIEHNANPNVVGAHVCSLLFMAVTCADISFEQRRELISLLREKGAKLFPNEAEELYRVAPWSDAHTWPVMKVEVHKMLIAPGTHHFKYKSTRKNIISGKTLEELRKILKINAAQSAAPKGLHWARLFSRREICEEKVRQAGSIN